MNIFLFFYLFVLFVLLTPGVIITLSIMKSSPYSKWIVAAIHGFLFSAIAITTYSFVNELYLSLIVTENLDINTGYTYTSTDGPKDFNDPSLTPPAKISGLKPRGPDIKCGRYGFCVSGDPTTKRAYCYGASNGCKWGSGDCGNDNDCTNKYNGSSIKFSDADYSNSFTCNNVNSTDGWIGDTCNMARINMLDKKFN
jgi:hypothetical protein